MPGVYARPLPAATDLERIACFAAGEAYGFVLDSGVAETGWRFMGFSPRWRLESRGPVCRLIEDARETVTTEPALSALRRALAVWHLEAPQGMPPFWGGAVGYLSYDLGWQLERLPRLAVDDLELPEMAWGFYDVVVAVPTKGPALLCVSLAPGEEPRALEAKVADWERRLCSLPPVAYKPSLSATGSPRSNFTRTAYQEAIGRLLEHIAAGDLYQANLSQRFSIPVEGDAYAWFETLRRQNPAPFAAFLNRPDARIVSASPERFLRRVGDRLETAPIKGTRARGRTETQDRALALALATSEKDRAEHLMIVDLERNDLGRVCRAGTVRVPTRFELAAHPTVWHLVSTVTGEVAPALDAVDLIAATFPGGSITGAPKIRAMEVIERLEPTRRSVYTGSIGYLARDGAFDLNIAIRTALVTGDRAYVQVGGGIVADSDPDEEYEETLAKAWAFFRSLEVDTRCVSSSTVS